MENPELLYLGEDYGQCDNDTINALDFSHTLARCITNKFEKDIKIKYMRGEQFEK